MHDIRANASQQLAFVQKNVRIQSSSTKEKKIYNTHVRPHMEYAATVWDPHISKQKNSLELIQRRAARWVTNRYNNTLIAYMLHTPGWTSLEHRRATSRLCILSQLDHGSIGIPHDPYILPYRHTPRPSRQTDMHTLATYQCRTNYFKCSFFPPNNCCCWNALPKSVVNSLTLGAFKVEFILRFYLSFIF